MQTLRKGDRGNAVTLLQQQLILAGYPLYPVDGIFGNDTDQAVRKLQADLKLGVDGVVGPQTWNGLETAIEQHAIKLSLKTIREGSTGSLVKFLQDILISHDYKLYPTTSQFDSRVDSAVRDFQQREGLLADGIVGPVTWAALGLKEPRLSGSNAIAIPIPVAQLTTSDKGLQFLYTREAWQNVSNRLHWPGGGSGVTLGPGYDMKERSEADIIRDMTRIGVQADKAQLIAKASGLAGSDAREFSKANRNLVVLSNQIEFQLMKMIVPPYERHVRGKITVDLKQYEFDSLVSFAYNLGTVWDSIASHINNGRIDDAMKRMQQANTSGGEVNDGLTRRRALEIALYTLGDYGELREV